ncbi:hypothetical protein ACVU7I_02390 [Patulibacter sp. S7RM1-6]
MPIVLNDREAFRFAMVHEATMEGRGPSGLADFVALTRELKSQDISPSWGITGRKVATGSIASMRAIAPTDEVVSEGIIALTNNTSPGSKRIRSVSANRTSLVLAASWGTHRVLLAGDLEAGPTGWTAVISNEHAASEKFSLVKVPHHGSSDADEPKLWTDLATNNPVKIVTRYCALTEPLPTPPDLDRLHRLGGRTYMVGDQSGDHHPTELSLHLNSLTRGRVKRTQGSVGAARARLVHDSSGGALSWTVDMFDAVRFIG